ncbi:MAG TPA: LPD7 domain-containing protein, partial [Phenylobacterium sp.]|nr:LPD7 domain-containing protein [Phenylobacterium sp.]
MTLSPRAASRITLGLALLAAASPAFAQTTGGVGGSLTGFLQMPPDHLIVLKAGSLPVRGRKITYHRERPFQARLLPAPLVPARAPPSATAQPRRPVPEPTDGLLSLDIVAATLASADPQPPPQGAADAEIETWVDRFLETPPPVTRRHDMSDRPDITNRMQTAGAARSTQAGDVPDALRRRYLTETGRGHASIAYYVDASVLIPSFRDGGRELVATRSDPNTVSDLICIAQHRGWSQVQVRGATGFRREA